MGIDELTPEHEALKTLGRRLAQVRKRQGLSQTRLAEEAGLGVATLRRIEAGQDSQMGSWIKLLKTLHMSASLDALVPASFQSPMAEALASRKGWRRKPKAAGLTWGDEVT